MTQKAIAPTLQSTDKKVMCLAFHLVFLREQFLLLYYFSVLSMT